MTGQEVTRRFIAAFVNLVLGAGAAVLVGLTHGWQIGLAVFIALGYVSDIREELRIANAGKKP